MSLRATLSYPGNRPAALLAKRAARGSEDLSFACMDGQRTVLSIGRRAHFYIPRSERFPAAPEAPAACCCLDTETRIAGDWIRCGYQRHRRGCLWQFRKYSILSAGGGDKQTDARYPPRGSYRELLQNSHTAFPTNSPLPTTLAVRFRS